MWSGIKKIKVFINRALMKKNFLKMIMPSFLWNMIEQNPELGKIVANINWLFLDKAIQLGISLFVGVWVIRYLGPEKYGILSYAIAFVYLFSFISKLGLDSIVMREIVKDPSKKEKIMGTTFFLKIASGIITFILCTVTVFFLKAKDQLSLEITVILALSFIFQATDVIDSWFQSRVESKFVVLIRNFSSILISLFKIILIVFHASLLMFALAILLEIVIDSIGLVFLYTKKHASVLKWKPNFLTAKELLKDSWPLMASGAAVLIYMKIDQIMIGNMLNNRLLGNYSAAVSLCEIWYYIPVIIVSSVFPAIIYSKKANEQLYLKRVQMLYDFLAWVAIIIAILVSLLSGKIVNLLFGPQYSQSAGVLAIYIWSGIAVFLGTASSSYLIAENFTKISLCIAIIGAASNVLFNFLLIPIYGITGSAIATLISYFIATFSVIFFKKSRKNFFMLIDTFNIFRIKEIIFSKKYEEII